MDYLGIQFESSGGNYEVSQVAGVANAFPDAVNFVYAGGEDPHFSIDHLSNSAADVLYRSEDNLPRVFVYNTGNYKAISGSLVLGAFADGDSLSLKTYILAEFINYFLGVSPVTAVEEIFNKGSVRVSLFPNPFSKSVEFEITVNEKMQVLLTIFDESGHLVNKLEQQNLSPGVDRFSWDATNENGNRVKQGIYLYRLLMNDKVESGKIVFMD